MEKDKDFQKFRIKMIGWVADYTVACFFREKENKDPLVSPDRSDLHGKLCKKIWKHFQKLTK